MPKISVIMPVHNEPENVLKSAISSILKQTYNDFEFIIINDGSEDYIEDIILSYKDSRIKYYKNETNLKVIKTLNKGLDLANCEYIARMDADDISFKTRFEKQVKILDENPDIGLVSGQCYIFPSKRLVSPPQHHKDIEKILKYSVNCVVHPLVMFRKSILKENHLKYSQYHLHIEDYKLWIDMCNCTNLYTIQEPLLLHREWSESVSRKHSLEQYINAKMLVFDSILQDVNISNPSLNLEYYNFLKGANISINTYLEIESILNKAQRRLLNEIQVTWRNYIFKDIENLKKNLYNKINW